ncbi:hypothetical protein pb186bvf_017872 [Paramecium bursaria]
MMQTTYNQIVCLECFELNLKYRNDKVIITQPQLYNLKQENINKFTLKFILKSFYLIYIQLYSLIQREIIQQYFELSNNLFSSNHDIIMIRKVLLIILFLHPIESYYQILIFLIIQTIIFQNNKSIIYQLSNKFNLILTLVMNQVGQIYNLL